MSTKIEDVARSLETWAPPGTAESWDKVGLHVGDPNREVTTALIGLDPTPALLEEAKLLGAELIITHHPLLLKPVSTLTPASPTGHLALRLAEAGIALYCIHTNLDSARGGVSFALAEQIGLEHIRFLSSLDTGLVKLAVFVPESHAEDLRSALAEAGAGRIGNYEACSFSLSGTGTFRPLKGSNPKLGEAGGKMETVSEIRIEVEVARWNLSAVLKALLSAHPYDEVAYDIYPIEQPYRDAGIGAIGELPESESLEVFLGRVSSAVDNPALRYAGELNASVLKVAVCGGAGTPYIPFAMHEKADVYVTSDLSHHRFFEVLNNQGRPEMALVDAGHYETERFTEDILKKHLFSAFPDVDWHVTSTRTAAVQTYVHPE